MLEELRQQRKIGKLHIALDDKERYYVDLSSVVIDGFRYVLPEEVHGGITQHFWNWYARPTSLDSVAIQLDTDDTLWKTLDVSQVDMSKSDIPRSAIEDLFETLKCRATRRTKSALTAAMTTPFTLEAFCAAVRALNYDRAPGPSMVTSNMFKALPLNALEYMFNLLDEMWKTRCIPSWWKDHTMCLAPKSEHTDLLDQMRPIGLFEISRKIWTGMVVNRIHSIW
jgi:hypothetical protein